MPAIIDILSIIGVIVLIVSWERDSTDGIGQWILIFVVAGMAHVLWPTTGKWIMDAIKGLLSLMGLLVIASWLFDSPENSVRQYFRKKT